MHLNLKFTLGTEIETCGSSSLDMRVNHVGNKNTKKTGTGVVLNYNCESPTTFKAGIVGTEPV